MNIKDFNLTILFIFILFGSLSAQTLSDALRYSALPHSGPTARSMGVVGSLGALGADFSVLSTNPAGMASYRKSDFVFTMGMSTVTNESRLTEDTDRDVDRLNEVFKQSKNRLNFPNIGFVLAHRPKASDWKIVNFGFGFNRIGNFHHEMFYQGQSFGSITDRFLELASGLDTDELDAFEAGLAYEVGAIWDPEGKREYVSDYWIHDRGEPLEKEQLIRTKGGITEMVLSFSGNYEEKLSVGLTIGVPFVRFEEERTYIETDDEKDLDNPMEFLEFSEELNTTGAGINAKLGLIYKPVHEFRIGLAVHTPTLYSLKDDFFNQLTYRFNEDGTAEEYSSGSPDGFFDYRLKTPWKLIASGGYIFGKSGFISAELEYVDFSANEFNLTAESSNPDDASYERELNQQIIKDLESALNLKFGAEWSLKKLRLRGGYAIISSPFVGETENDQIWSAGLGIRENNFYIDMAYQQHSAESSFSPYLTFDPQDMQFVHSDNRQSQIVLSLGFKF